jgi:hypothetical protein
MTAWLTEAGSAMFGDTVFGIRVFALVFSLLSAWVILNWSGDLYQDEAAALWAAVPADVCARFCMPGVIFNRESVMIFFWLLSYSSFPGAGGEGTPAKSFSWAAPGVSLAWACRPII